MYCGTCLNSYLDVDTMRIVCDKDVVCNGEYYDPIAEKEMIEYPSHFDEAKISGKEMINHPSHYNMVKYEAIDVIEDWQLNFNLGNTVKYISRAGHKDDIVQDLKKALWYLEREIKRIENTK